MNMLAKKLNELGDADLKASDFWEKYKTEEDFVNEMLAPAPGRVNVGTPIPYPQYPEGYKLIGTPDSLEKGEVTVDNAKKVVKGKPVTVEWLRNNHGVAIWPMSWYRYKNIMLMSRIRHSRIPPQNLLNSSLTGQTAVSDMASISLTMKRLKRQAARFLRG